MKIGTRRLLGSMWTILVLLASALFGACTEITVNAFAGEDVVLPCFCNDNKENPYLVWQIGNTIVDQYISGYNKSDIAHQFQGRTSLFLLEDTANCSLLLKNVTTADNKTFTCHYMNPIHTSSEVTLNVSVAHVEDLPTEECLHDEDPRPRSGHEKLRVAYAISGVLLCVALLLTVFLTLRYRQRCQSSNVNESGAEDGELRESLQPGRV